MSAPLLWIGLPLLLGGALLFSRRAWVTAAFGALTALLLAILAWALPLDRLIVIGTFSFKVGTTLSILGRSLTIEPADQPLLALLYGLLALWLFGAAPAGVTRRMVPLGLAITALLIAAMTVEPFLYAALLLETAALLAVPLLLPPGQRPGRGLLRFIVYQTLAMPLILFAGWLLVGVEASPGDLALAVQAGTLLGLGFALLLAIFPLYTWVTLLSEEASPYAAGFLFWVLPTATLLFAPGFLDRYTWLRTAPALPLMLRLAGLLMLVSAGWWAAFERRPRRLMGYGAIAEIGLGLLALSLFGSAAGVMLMFLLILPRALHLAVWSLGLSALGEKVSTFRTAQGLLRTRPVAAAAVALAHLSVAGLPLLAGFPFRLAIWERLAMQSPPAAIWLGLGLLGLLTGAMRTLATLAMAPAGTDWTSRETWPQRILLAAGILLLIVIGLFPGLALPLPVDLTALFEQLGR